MGAVMWTGIAYSLVDGKAHAKGYNTVQYLHQSPIFAVDPRWTVGRIIAEGWSPDEETRQALGVSKSWYDRFPHEISGGELQRIAVLREERFQTGHMIAIYWSTVSRWMMQRARRDAKACKTPLFLVQAADVSKPAMPIAFAKKFMNVANPKDSGDMHGLLALHLGMRIRLLDALDKKKTLVKDAEGEIVRIVPQDGDAKAMEDALQMESGTVYFKQLPKGIWAQTWPDFATEGPQNDVQKALKGRPQIDQILG